MPWCCSCWTPSTMGCSSRRSSSACGWCRWAISPTSQAGSPRPWPSCSSWQAAPTLLDLLAAFLVPDFGQLIHTFIVIIPAIAEIWMVGYLLAIGVKTVKSVKPDEYVLAPA
jgi:hypothetical protein